MYIWFLLKYKHTITMQYFYRTFSGITSFNHQTNTNLYLFLNKKEKKIYKQPLPVLIPLECLMGQNIITITKLICYSSFYGNK